MSGALPQLKEFFYLDEQGIESLYAQTVAILTVEKTSTIEKTLSGKASIKLKFKQILLQLLGAPDVEGSGELSGARKRIEEAKLKLTTEHMLRDLLTSLENVGEPLYFTSLVKAAKHTSDNKQNVFVCVGDIFDAPQFYGNKDGAFAVNKTGYLLLEKGRPGSYNERDDYFKVFNQRLVLAANVNKLFRSIFGKMGVTGHDAIFLKGYKGRDIPLTVFGSFSSVHDFFQIKPYAIWR